MANAVIDKLVVLLELDASQFQEGIAAAKAALESLGGMVKLISAPLDALGKDLARAGQMGQVAGQKTATGFNQMRGAVMAARAEVDKLKSAMASGQKGAAELGGETAKVGPTADAGFGGMVSGAMLAGMAVRALIREVSQMIGTLNDLVGMKAVLKWFDELSEAMDKTWRFADGLHVAIGELQAWHDEVKMWGGTAAAFDKTLENVEGKIGAVGTKLRGGKQALEAFKLMGIDEAKAKTLDLFQTLELFATNVGSGKLDDKRALAVKKALGIDEATFQMIKQSGALFKDMLESRRKIANTDEEVMGLTAARKQWEDLDQKWEHAKVTLISALAPAIEKVAALLERFVDWVRENPEEATKMFYAIVVAVTALAAALSLLTIVAGILVTAVLAPLAMLCYELYDYFNDVSKSVDNFENKLKKLYNTARMTIGVMTGGLGFLLPKAELEMQIPKTPAMDNMRQMIDSFGKGEGLGGGAAKLVKSHAEIHNLNIYSGATDAAGMVNDIMHGLQTKFGQSGFAPVADGGVR